MVAAAMREEMKTFLSYFGTLRIRWCTPELREKKEEERKTEKSVKRVGK